jgi:arylsulfatase A-like enzyme
VIIRLYSFHKALLLMGWLTYLTDAVAQSIPKPNVIIILADDMGYGDVAILNPNAKTRTPHIDAMASMGMTFTDAHAPASLCTPTRYALLTGRYAWRGPLKKGVSRQYDPPLIEEGRPVLGGLFQQAGYQTACIGKWHLGWDWPLKNGGLMRDIMNDPDADAARRLEVDKEVDFNGRLLNGPTTRGFHRYFGDDVPNYPPYAFIQDDRLISTPSIQKPDSMYGHPGSMTPGWRLDSVLPIITQRAVAYIEEMASKQQPFFLFFSLTSPHVPIAPSANFRGRSGAGAWGDFVEETDASVGAIMQALQRSGITENTLVIFSSDNGSPAQDGSRMAGAFNSVQRFGHDPNAPFRGMKTDLWEGGHHVPFFAVWPQRIRALSKIARTICQVDLMATCAEILNTPLPENAGKDGYSLVPLLTETHKRKYKRKETIHHSSEGFFAIRQGRWKLILAGHSGGGLVPRTQETVDGNPVDRQLYDLKKDPKESRNLILKRPKTAEKLALKLQQVRSTE